MCFLSLDNLELICHRVIHAMLFSFAEVARIQWGFIVEGLIDGCRKFFESFSELKKTILRKVPQLLEEGRAPCGRFCMLCTFLWNLMCRVAIDVMEN